MFAHTRHTTIFDILTCRDVWAEKISFIQSAMLPHSNIMHHYVRSSKSLLQPIIFSQPIGV